MVVLIGLLAFGVVYLAVKSPDVNQAPNGQDPGPNVNLPAIGAVGNPSPAMSGGTPVASQTFRTAMLVNAGIVGVKRTQGSNLFNPLNAVAGTLRPPSQTVSEMGKTLMTQAPTALPKTGNAPVFAGLKL